MASAVTTQRLASNAARKMYDHDPGATTAVITSPDGGTTKQVVAMQNYEWFGVGVMLSVAAGGVTLVEIVGCTDSAGSDPTVVVSSGAVDADAVGDFVWVECSAAQVNEVGRAAGLALTHVAARITCSNAGDEAVVYYERAHPRFATADLTANAIA